MAASCEEALNPPRDPYSKQRRTVSGVHQRPRTCYRCSIISLGFCTTPLKPLKNSTGARAFAFNQRRSLGAPPGRQARSHSRMPAS
eukprot:460528-Pyramimonas_sp.AAC.1